MALLFALVVMAVFFGLIAARRHEKARREWDATTVELVVDDTGVRRRLQDGRTESVSWGAITAVEVITTAVGVHREDGVLVVLCGDRDTGCLVPSQLGVANGLFAELDRLPAFDHQALVEAMQRPPPSRQTCWTRADRHETP